MSVNKKILVVDDDESILKFTKMLLEEDGYLVATAGTGEEAIRECEKGFFDMALLDIRLPDMDGTELLKKLRHTPMLKIMITGFPSQENAIDALNFGADAYVIKPIKADALLEIIQEHLEKKRENVVSNQNAAVGWIGDFISLVKGGQQEWFTFDFLVRELNISVETIQRLADFCDKQGLVKLKCWSDRKVIQVIR